MYGPFGFSHLKLLTLGCLVPCFTLFMLNTVLVMYTVFLWPHKLSFCGRPVWIHTAPRKGLLFSRVVKGGHLVRICHMCVCICGFLVLSGPLPVGAGLHGHDSLGIFIFHQREMYKHTYPSIQSLYLFDHTHLWLATPTVKRLSV